MVVKGMQLNRYWRETPLIRWAALALFVSAGPINILLHGLFGSGSLMTATVLFASLAALFVLGDWRSLRQDVCDMCFIAFVGYAAISSAVHPWADAKEVILFSMSLLSYCAGRLFAAHAVEPIFSKVALTIATVGAILMVGAMLQGSLDIVGKPLLFGTISAAPVQFAVPFFLAIGAILAREKIVVRPLSLTLIAILAVAFAAAMVRFVFVAALGAFLVLALVSQRSIRRLVVAAMVALLVALAIGLASRPQVALKYKELAERALGISNSNEPVFAPPANIGPAAEGCPPIDETNSIEVRKALYRNWAQLIPDSGLLGIGLDGFMHRSCRPMEQVHNTLLQIVLEFGWPAAGLFSFILVTAFVRLFRARSEEQARFGLFALSFLVLMSMAHGNVSRDRDMFLFIGYAVSQRRVERSAA